MTESAKRFLTATLFGALAAYTLFVSISRPFHNWDALAYVASAKSFEVTDPEAIHRFAYRSVRDAVSDNDYAALAHPDDPGTTNPTVYRYTMSRDAEAFGEQLPFYQVRPAYTFAIFVLYKCGVEIESATYLISGVAVALAIWLLYYIVIVSLDFPLALTIPALAILFGVADLGRYSTPDGFAFLGILIAAWLLITQRIRFLLCALLAIALIRSDVILFTLPLLLALFISKQAPRIGILICAIGSLALVWMIVAYWQNPGWQTQFYCSTVERCIHPLSQPPSMSARIYFDAVASGLKALIVDRNFLFYLVGLGIFICACVIRTRVTSITTVLRSAPAILAFASLAYIAGRFFILPSQWERFFVAPYLLTLWAALTMARDVIGDRRLRVATALNQE